MTTSGANARAFFSKRIGVPLVDGLGLLPAAMSTPIDAQARRRLAIVVIGRDPRLLCWLT
jgi:hypothetical protein